MRFAAILLVLFPTWIGAAEPTAAEKGRKALETTAFIPPAWSKAAYQNLWKQWEGVREKPKDYDQAVREVYGLHPAPYENNNLPMGLRHNNLLLFQGITVDCMTCHGGSIMGKSYIGLGNSALDIQGLFEDLSAADGRNPKLPFTFTNVRGTSEAAGMSVYLLGFRDAEMNVRRPRVELGLHDDLCEDVPAWWLLKKKKTMYFTGEIDARSVRSKMQFMMTPLTPLSEFERHEKTFRDIQAYLMQMESPKYPMKIDQELAAQGEKIFLSNCSSCHGTYGAKSTYPNKIIPIDKIGTDRRRFDGLEARFGEYYNQTWFAKEKRGWMLDGYRSVANPGYQAPPLDGIWATAPYLHNGSVPTLYNLLKSETRPRLFTRSYRTDLADYDTKNIGWKIQEITETPNPKLSPREKRKIYDTRELGRSNQGHTYGDSLTEAERMAVIEYLKTL